MKNEEFQNSLIIGVLSGVIAGIILLFGQFVAKVYGQEYNILLIASISAIGVILMVIIFAWKNSKREKSSLN